MKTILTLILLVIAGVVLLSVLAAIYALFSEVWRAARSVWRRLLPLAVGLVAGGLAFTAVSAAGLTAVEPELLGAVCLTITLAGSIGSYMAFGRWFASNRSARYYPETVQSPRETLIVEAPTVVAQPFRRLRPKRRFWMRKSDDRRVERFLHVIAYLRGMVTEQHDSLRSSQAAVLGLWNRSGDPFDQQVNAMCGDVLTWLNESERSLEDTQGLTRGQRLIQCERLERSLAQIAVRARDILARRGDDEINMLKLRAESIAEP